MVNISTGVEQINFYNAKPRVAVFTLCLMTQGRVIDVGMKRWRHLLQLPPLCLQDTVYILPPIHTPPATASSPPPVLFCPDPSSSPQNTLNAHKVTLQRQTGDRLEISAPHCNLPALRFYDRAS